MIENATVKQRIEQFDTKHGRSVFTGRWIFYENGANRDMHPLGPLNEPPEDPYRRHRNVVLYHEAVVEKLAAEFDERKRLYTHSGGLYPDEEENIKRLRTLQRRVRHCQRNLNNARLELRRVTPGHQHDDDPETQRMNANMAAREQRYRATLDDIKI